MKIVYITGCLGFIGSYVTRKCIQRGWKVYGIDKCTYVSNLSLLSEFERYDNFQFQKIDIKDMNHLYDCDYIINTAAESHSPHLIHRISFTELKFECRTRVAAGTSAGRSTLRHNRTHAPTGPRRARTDMRI